MIEQYSLAPFLDGMPERDLIVGERFMVSKPYRGTDVLTKMFNAYLNFVNENRIQLIFGDCEPYLLNLYLGMGFRTYSKRNVNSAETGYLIPLVMVPEDMDYMRQIRSPLVSILQDFGTDDRLGDTARKVLAAGSAVISERLTSSDEYWSEINQYINEHGDTRPGLFSGFDDDSINLCLGKSTIIECQQGDMVIKKDNFAQNLFFVLSGFLQVGDDEEGIVGMLEAGDVFGEIAFLLGKPRTRNVLAATDGTKVVCMSENTIRKLIETDSEVAAKLLLNISKMLCMRLITTSHNAA